MSAESPFVPPPPPDTERINWNELLRYSFMFSQGDPDLQNSIFSWIAKGPLRGHVPQESDFKNGILTAYATGNEAHKGISPQGTTTEALEAGNFRAAFVSGRHADLVAALLVKRERHYLLHEGGRPAGIEKGGRDRWSSFIVDFGLLKKGTGPWKWDALPPVYKRFWDEAVREIARDPALKTDAAELLDIYLAKHPEMAPDERETVQAYRNSLGKGP